MRVYFQSVSKSYTEKDSSRDSYIDPKFCQLQATRLLRKPAPIVEKDEKSTRMKGQGLFAINQFENFFTEQPRKPCIRPLTPPGTSSEYKPKSKRCEYKETSQCTPRPSRKKQINNSRTQETNTFVRTPGRKRVDPQTSTPRELQRKAVYINSNMGELLKDKFHFKPERVSEKPNNMKSSRTQEYSLLRGMANIYKHRQLTSSIFKT